MARKTKEMNPRQVDTLPDGFRAAATERPLSAGHGRGRRRVWVFRFVRSGKVTSMGLGEAGQGGVSLADARDEAKKLNEAIKSGVNPLMARREKQRSEAARKTLRQATEAYIEEKNPKWGASSRAIWRRFADRDIEVIADIPVDTLGREDIKRAVNALYQMTGKGNRMRQTRRARRPPVAAAHLDGAANTLPKWAGDQRTRPSSGRWWPSAPTAKPSAAIRLSCRPKSDNKHDAALIVEAIKRLRASDSVSARCLEFIALTAVRVGEATRPNGTSST